ncbi:hypothetical protein Cgig2_011712 [Carnegiea gigantea]|uniref:F-box domain-containing protein n=1 Tax=Carnegiea gigantea TaxID=171969 RepID=A0A9Q1JXJ5_9CARY|nr:hypothetical protein Cgig2_011712 [Carnegiea gigantea]
MRSYSDLPDEIIVGIISRLPAKSVGQCRCVCKSWRALLSRRKFIRDHFNQSRSLLEESLIFTSYKRGYLFYAPLKSAGQVFDEIAGKNLSFAGQPDCRIDVWGSCDGLLLVLRMDRMFVLNPVTKEVREVPRSPFAPDPCKRYVMSGFGYDSVNDDYKIMKLLLWPLIWPKSKFRQLLLPSLAGYMSDDVCVTHLLVAIGGYLCTFKPEEVDICVMKEYGIKKSWTRFTMDGLDAFEVNPLYTVGLGQEEVVLLKKDMNLVFGNLKDRTFKNVVRGIPNHCFPEASFVDSLISPLVNNEPEDSELIRLGSALETVILSSLVSTF